MGPSCWASGQKRKCSHDVNHFQGGYCDDSVHVSQVMQGMVFVWGESGPQAAAEADAMPVPGLPDLEQSEAKPMRSKSGQPMKNFIKSYYRELPYGWEVLAENLQDPCKICCLLSRCCADADAVACPLSSALYAVSECS